MSRWSWPLALLVALVYVLCFASFIGHHTVLPSYDGKVYVAKTSEIAEQVHRASALGRLNPLLYLRIAPAERPPLLLGIAAVVLGVDAQPQSIALVWLGVRVGVILLALYLLSRELRTSRFVLAAALVIFASPLMDNFYRLYMMDEPFAAFGLLAFALIVIDDRRATVFSAAGGAAGILLLFLVKPVAPAFLAPLVVIRATRAIIPLFQQGGRGRLRSFFRWLIPYGVLLLIVLYVFYLTPYGAGVRTQYQLGQTGYWHNPMALRQALTWISFLVPPWILLSVLVAAPFARLWPNRVILLYTTAMLTWWVLFSFFMTYAVEDRLLGQAMPIVVVGLLIGLCERPSFALLATVVALGFFAFNTLILTGRLVPPYERLAVRTVYWISPFSGRMQPTAEVGLIPFAREAMKVIPSDSATDIVALCSEPDVEPGALGSAFQIVAPETKGRLFINGMPEAPKDFLMATLCAHRWFITKTLRQTVGYSTTGIWTSLRYFHAIVTDPQSPMHAYFQKRCASPVHAGGLDDTLVLWELPQPPPASVLKATLAWIAPRVAGDSRAAVIQEQLQALSSGK